jgi:hypothetical protein
MVKALRSPEENEKNRTEALRRKFEKTGSRPDLRPLQVLGDGDMSVLEAIAQGQSQPSEMGLDMRQQVRDGLGAFCYYICVTMYQASSVGTDGGAACSAVSADFEQHTPSIPGQLEAQGSSQMVKALRSPEEIEKNRTEALRRKFEKTGSRPDLRPLQVNALAALQRSGWESSIIVMPTGSGKSRLIWSLNNTQECAIIFAPYRLLVNQLVTVLTEHGPTFLWPLTQQQGSVDLLLSTAQFVVTSFENASDCLGLVTQLKERLRLGPIWVDEVIGICQN